MINIPQHNIQITKQLVQDNKKINKLSNNKEIEKDLEIKNIYLDKNLNDITNKENIWKDDLINKSTVKICWDNKNKMFLFDFSFLEKNVVDEIKITINNEKTYSLKSNLDLIDKIYNQKIYSTELFNNSYNIDNIKTIQILLKNNNLSKLINIIWGPYKILKNDFLIKKDQNLSLNFQNSITIKGEEIKKNFSTLKFSPVNLLQGFWNQNIMKIEQSSDQIFERNSIFIKSLQNLPITESSKSNFDSFINDQYLQINQNTYYDEKKKETMKGFGKNSNPGYIVPFEFSGMFYPILEIDINNCYFKISWEQNFDKPYFKKNEGINKIFIKNSSVKDEDNDWIKINNELIEQSKEYNFTFNEFKEWLISKNKK